jgi:hypothetical protein
MGAAACFLVSFLVTLTCHAPTKHTTQLEYEYKEDTSSSGGSSLKDRNRDEELSGTTIETMEIYRADSDKEDKNGLSGSFGTGAESEKKNQDELRGKLEDPDLDEELGKCSNASLEVSDLDQKVSEEQWGGVVEELKRKKLCSLKGCEADSGSPEECDTEWDVR